MVEGMTLTMPFWKILWQAYDKWQTIEETYNTVPFVSLKAEDIANELGEILSKSFIMLDKSPQSPVARFVEEKINQHKKLLPYILALANPGIMR